MVCWVFNYRNGYIQNMEEIRVYIKILIKIILTILKKESSMHTKLFNIIICRYEMLVLLCLQATKQERVAPS